MSILSFFTKKDSILSATKSEREAAVERLISSATVRSGYYLLLILASVISTAGILINSIAVVIGGMILAPLLIPILILSLSLLSGTMRGFLESTKVLLVSLFIAVVSAFLLTHAMEDFVPAQPLAIVQGIHMFVYVLIALCSGIAGALAWVKEDFQASMVGIAAAVSLLPPLNMMGVTFAMHNYDAFLESFTIFGANLIGISLGAYLVFLLLGFMNTKKVQEKVLKKEEKENNKA